MSTPLYKPPIKTVQARLLEKLITVSNNTINALFNRVIELQAAELLSQQMNCDNFELWCRILLNLRAHQTLLPHLSHEIAQFLYYAESLCIRRLRTVQTYQMLLAEYRAEVDELTILAPDPLGILPPEYRKK